jgi:hypothetical protein
VATSAVNGGLPRWTDWWHEADVGPMFADPVVRQKVIAEQPILPMSSYEQHIPVPGPYGWDDHPCSYSLFGPPRYAISAEASERGRRVARLPRAHLHQIIDPAGTARHSPAQPGTSSNSPLRLDPLPMRALMLQP